MSHLHKVLIVGGDSYIAKALIEQLVQRNIPYLATSRYKKVEYLFLDLIDEDTWLQLQKSIEEEQFSCVIFLASVTTEQACINDPDIAHTVNVISTCKLLHYFDKQNVFSIFMSSSQVFDHQQAFIKYNAPYGPTTLYGKYKAEVEQYIARHQLNSAIVRSTKIIGIQFDLFKQAIVQAQKKQVVVAFNDYCAAPVSLINICKVLINISMERKKGVYQLSGSEDLSYYEMIKRLLAYQGITTEIRGISSISKNISPVAYGSLQSESAGNFIIKNECYESVIKNFH